VQLPSATTKITYNIAKLQIQVATPKFS